MFDTFWKWIHTSPLWYYWNLKTQMLSSEPQCILEKAKLANNLNLKQTKSDYHCLNSGSLRLQKILHTKIKVTTRHFEILYWLSCLVRKTYHTRESCNKLLQTKKWINVHLSNFTTVEREFSTNLMQQTVDLNMALSLGNWCCWSLWSSNYSMMRTVFTHVAHWFETGSGKNQIDLFGPQLSFQLKKILRYPRAYDLLRGLLLLSGIRMDHWLKQMFHMHQKTFTEATQRKHFLTSR